MQGTATVLLLSMWGASGWPWSRLWLGSFFLARLDTVSSVLKLHDDLNDLPLRCSALLGSSITEELAQMPQCPHEERIAPYFCVSYLQSTFDSKHVLSFNLQQELIQHS